MNVDFLIGNRVPLGWTTGTRTRLAFFSAALHYQVTVVDQAVEMMSGDIGMYGEKLRNSRGIVALG